MAATTAAAITAPPSGLRNDAFLTRIVVMVDEATEPSLPDSDASRRRADLVAMANGASQHGSAPVGANIAFAIRKRLKSDDSTAVMNTLKLLDELMRSCPYFYRYVADEKMFRRLWRFVVPDYKNGMRSMLPFPGHRSRTAADLRASAGRPDIAVKVLILIRAWAEELSEMHNGKYDPSAGFLIERYNSKRARVKFPDVPSTELPWVCPVGTTSTNHNSSNSYKSAYRSGAAGSSSRKANGVLPESLGLDEVENTVNLFENILENAASVAELKTDVSKELVSRCRIIGDNLDKLSMSMDKEEELTRAIKVSEKLNRALNAYDASIRTGEVSKPIPIISRLSESPVDSERDEYDGPRPVDNSSLEHRSERSLDDDRNHASRFVSPQPTKSGIRSKMPRAATTRFGRDRKKLPTSRSHDSHLDAAASEPELTARERQERREEAQRRFHREYVASKRGTAVSRRERSLSPVGGERRFDRAKTHANIGRSSRGKRRDERSESESDEREVEDERDGREGRDRRNDRRNDSESGSRKKSTKREMKKANSVYDSSAGVSSSKPPKNRKTKEGRRRIGRSATTLDSNALVDIGVPEDNVMESGESSDDVRRPRDTFSKLGERYEQGDDDQQTSTDTELNGNMQSLNIAPSSGPPANPMSMYQTAPYGSVMMMPPGMAMMNPMAMYNTVNPMAMYGSVNPMMQGMPQPNAMVQPNPMFGAYSTVNPAMYYNSMNPMANPMGAYASHSPAPAMFPNPYMTQNQPTPQSTQQAPQGSPPQLTSPSLQSQQPQQQVTPPLQAMPGSLQLVPQPEQQQYQQTSPPQQSQQSLSQQAMPTQVTPQMPMMMFPTPYAFGQPQVQPPGGPAPVPPPPPAASYTTVSNAPLPPPSMPPPPPAQQQPLVQMPQPTLGTTQTPGQQQIASVPPQHDSGNITNEQRQSSANAAPVPGAT